MPRTIIFVQPSKETKDLSRYRETFQDKGYAVKITYTINEAVEICSSNDAIVVFGNSKFIKPIEHLTESKTLIYWDADNSGEIPRKHVSRMLYGDLHPSDIFKAVNAQLDYLKLQHSLNPTSIP